MIGPENDPTGWFDRLYAAAEAGQGVVPWDRGRPNDLLVEWATDRGVTGAGRRALVVGAGLGRDAEFVAGLGYDTTAFDISPTAVRGAQARHLGSAVRYLVADLLDPPAGWRDGFDLVVESYTVQALPDPPRRTAIGQVATMVAPGGTLLVIAFGTESAAGYDGPPWPLRRDEIEAFAAGAVAPVRIEQLPADEAVGEFRWRAEFARPPAAQPSPAGPAGRAEADPDDSPDPDGGPDPAGGPDPGVGQADPVHLIEGVRVLVGPADGPPLRAERDAVELIAEAISHGAALVALPVRRLHPDFFRLRTRVAGEFVQKFVNYQLRLAVVGPIDEHTAGSTAFRDFVTETNRRDQLWFVPSMTELAARLRAGAGSTVE